MHSVVIDGYNVIYAIPDLRKKILKNSPAGAREALIDICVRYRNARKDISCIYIVFDGRKQDDPASFHREEIPPHTKSCGIKIIFSRDNKKADDIIIDLIRDNDRPQSFVVVSSDNYVRNNSRAYCARLMSPASFCSELGKKIINKAGTQKEVSQDVKPYKSEVTRWYKAELEKRGIFDNLDE